MALLRLLVFVLPLGLDTLGVSISIGIKSHHGSHPGTEGARVHLPPWLRSALLFSFAETIMPLFGLAIGYAASVVLSTAMHYVGPLLLIAVGLWELVEETRERWEKRRPRSTPPARKVTPPLAPAEKSSTWQQQLLLALSVSLDELAVGFSLGTTTVGRGVNPLTLCLLIGLQGFFMTLVGLLLGRTLRTRLRAVKDWSELLSGTLLVGLGIWLLVT